MSTVLTPQHTIDLSNVQKVPHVSIKIKLDVNENIVLINDRQTDSYGINLEGNAVVSDIGQVNWEIDNDKRINRIMIRPKEKLLINIWSTQKGTNMFKWKKALTVMVNKSNLARTAPGDYEWEYALLCELYEKNGPVKMIDPIIRVNK
jgi:hypothetical protein